ncbi:unnamed protein product [Larinioides sclopetarius]|uniref:BTB domain-containing protein n=1 Tax=Larinioides sclopetarius TaxID=280406 RepID=A0AAV2ABN0_9ARAC
MDKYCMHKEVCLKNSEDKYYLFTCSIPNASSISWLNFITDKFIMQNKKSYRVTVRVLKDNITLILTSEHTSTYKFSEQAINVKCSTSMFIGSETLLLSKKFDPPNYINDYTVNYVPSYKYVLKFSSEDESFQKLKEHPNDPLIIICRIKCTKNFSDSVKTPGNTSTGGYKNLKKLAAAFRNSSESLHQKVLLIVGQESETVNKAILCSRSPVFANMFQNNMREVSENTVIITDIKMPEIRALVSFLYTGKLPNYDFRFLCKLCYAADKYDIADLRQICVDLLLPQISTTNVFRALKLAFSHNIERLKSTVMACVAENIETLVMTNDWKNLLDDKPEIAVEIINFCEF